MADPLSGAWAKLRRAKTHHEAFADEEGRLGGGDRPHLHPVTYEVYRNGLEYRFYVEDSPPLDAERFAVIAGDCLFNLRSALDHLVYALHVKRFNGHVPADIESRIQFPILDRPRIARTAKWDEIGSLDDSVRRAIEFFQPYHRRDDDYAEIRRALSELNHLCRIDKHRHLHLVYVATWAAPVPWFGSEKPFDSPAPYGFRQQSFWVPLEGKTEVFRWTFDEVPPDIARHLHLNRHVSAGISLDEWGERVLIGYSLEAYVNRVALVLERFARFL